MARPLVEVFSERAGRNQKSVRYEKSISPLYGHPGTGTLFVFMGGRAPHPATIATTLRRGRNWTGRRIRARNRPPPFCLGPGRLKAMKTIFDRETEIGHADPETWGWEGGDLANAELLDSRI